MSDSALTLDMPGVLVRQVQAEQRNLRTEMATMMATMRGELTMFREALSSALTVFQTAWLGRLGENEALTESRFDHVEKTLADILARLPG